MADLVIFGQSAKQQMVDRCCVKGWRCVGSHQELYRGKTYQVLLTTISNTLTTINNFQIRQKSLESLHSRRETAGRRKIASRHFVRAPSNRPHRGEVSLFFAPTRLFHSSSLTNKGTMATTMHVIKRSGKKESVHFDKVTSRIQKLCYGLDAKVRRFGSVVRRRN